MDSGFSTLAEQIYYATPEDEQAIIQRIQQENPFSKAFSTVYWNLSPLVCALHKGYHNLAVEIIKKLPQNELLDSFLLKSFTWNYRETQEIASFFFLKLLDFDLDVFPLHVKPMIENLQCQRLLALLTGSEGESNFFGIPWRMEEYDDYTLVTRLLFRSVSKNQKKMLASLLKKAESFGLNQDNIRVLIKSIKQTISLMQWLQSPALEPGKPPEIFPILDGINARKPETVKGFVLFESRLLLEIDRNRIKRPGVLVYKISHFDKTLFNHFLVKEGPLGTRTINVEAGIDYCVETDYIPMTLAKKTNEIIHAAEGVFLGTLYCQLLKKGVQPNLAKKLAAEYVPFLFTVNTQFLIEDLKKILSENDPFFEQLGKNNPIKRLFEKLKTTNSEAPTKNSKQTPSLLPFGKKQATVVELLKTRKDPFSHSNEKASIVPIEASPRDFPHSNPLSEAMPLLGPRNQEQPGYSKLYNHIRYIFDR